MSGAEAGGGDGDGDGEGDGDMEGATGDRCGTGEKVGGSTGIAATWRRW